MCDNVLELFESSGLVKVCAPMVRYSKLPFRTLVRHYGCDLCFTPMILADSFIKSEMARSSEFSTNTADEPLVVQFAANNTHDFCTAAELVAPYSNGVDLNCGCPQHWAMKEGYGAHLLGKPELIRDIVLQVRNKIPHPFTVSVKIRILDDLRKTVEMCRMFEAAGVSFITVHGRTPSQKHQPINVNALRTIRDSVRLPLIANGDVKTLQDAEELKLKTGCGGVMAARGILTNPALFDGYKVTPVKCLRLWVAIGLNIELSDTYFHNHLTFMLEKIMNKKDRATFNSLSTISSILSFLNNYYNEDFTEIRYRGPAKEKCMYDIRGNPAPCREKMDYANYEELMENVHLFDS